MSGSKEMPGWQARPGKAYAISPQAVGKEYGPSPYAHASGSKPEAGAAPVSASRLDVSFTEGWPIHRFGEALDAVRSGEAAFDGKPRSMSDTEAARCMFHALRAEAIRRGFDFEGWRFEK
jgi:hypothetical protein